MDYPEASDPLITGKSSNSDFFIMLIAFSTLFPRPHFPIPIKRILIIVETEVLSGFKACFLEVYL